MNARQKQERNDRILANAARLEEIRNIVHRVLGNGVDPDLIHAICRNMRINGEMDTAVLEGDLKNARGFTEQIHGAEFANEPERVVAMYEDCTARDFEDEED